MRGHCFHHMFAVSPLFRVPRRQKTNPKSKDRWSKWFPCLRIICLPFFGGYHELTKCPLLRHALVQVLDIKKRLADLDQRLDPRQMDCAKKPPVTLQAFSPASSAGRRPKKPRPRQPRRRPRPRHQLHRRQRRHRRHRRRPELKPWIPTDGASVTWLRVPPC